MPKFNILSSIKSNSENLSINTTAIIQDDIIKYKEDSNTLVKFNYLTNEFIRETNEIIIKYTFIKSKNTKGLIYIKKLSKELEVEIKTTYLKRTNNDIEIKFIIEDNKFIYKIEVVKWVF